MSTPLSDFISYLYTEKGLSPASVEAYERDARGFLLFLEKKHRALTSIEEEDLLSYLSYLQEEGYASSSYARMTFALKVFFRFLIKEKLLSSSILLFFDSPKVWQLLPDVLTISEIEKLLSLPDDKTFSGARDRAILEVLYGSGLRVSELCSLNILDVDDQFVRVMGKGRKERLVPLGKKALEAIDHYSNFRTTDDKEKALFLNAKGKRIDRITVWRRVKEYVKRAGISKKVSPHTFRHSFATHILDGGGDLRIIQEMLGHASISSTERYTHVSHAKLQEAFLRHHPRLTKNE